MRLRLLLPLTVLLAGPVVHGSDFGNYGLTSRSISLGNAVTTTSKDLSALYYNPGNLADARNGMLIGMLATFNLLEIGLQDRPDGADVPDDVLDTTSAAPLPSLPTSMLRNERADTDNKDKGFNLAFGVAYDFGLEWFKLGIITYIPIADGSSSPLGYTDERAQFFDNQLHSTILGHPDAYPSILTGLAVAPTCWLKLGAAVNIHGQLVETLDIYTNNTEQTGAATPVLAQKHTRREAAASLIIGIQLDIFEPFGVGLVYHQATMFADQGTNRLNIWNQATGALLLEHGYNHLRDYSPHDLALGFRIGETDGSTLTVDLLWKMWSQWQPIGASSANVLRDSFVGRLGGDIAVADGVFIRLGAAFVSSAVPDQSGRSNYVDNHRVEVSLGGGFELPWPPKTTLDLHVQGLILIPRTYDKSDGGSDPVIDEYAGQDGIQTNNPGYPGYEAKGGVITAGLTLNIPFGKRGAR